ncbi:hypothetical protein PSTG_17117, partial [Puccinia striiformis f. sp. tritici PST-78]
MGRHSPFIPDPSETNRLSSTKGLRTAPQPSRHTHPPAGRAPARSASLAPTKETDPMGADYVDVVDAIDMDIRLFDDAMIEDSLPPDLTAGDWATINEINTALTDNVAGAEED